MGKCNTRERVRESSLATNLVFSRVCEEFDNRSYEGDGSPNMREQKEWMKNMSCVKIELDGAADLEKNADIIVNNWNGIVR